MKKENKKVYLFAFIVLIIFSICSILNIFRSHILEFSVAGLNFPTETIKINAEFNKKITDNIFVCYNDFCKTFEKDIFLNVLASSFSPSDKEFYDFKVTSISLAYPNKYSDIVKDISLFVGNKKYYYTKDDISNFNKKEVRIMLDEDTKQELVLNSIQLPKINNYKGIINHFVILMLSLFYKALVFIIPYIWLFAAYLIWKFKLKDENFKISNKLYLSILVLVGLLGIIFRLNELNYYPLWLDEIYIKTVGIKSFISCFQDPGNPPLFSIMEFFVSKISNSDIALRILPFVFGTLFIYFSYLIFNRFSKNWALFGTFFASFNLINIYHSSDIRSYSLCMFLALALIYYVFEYINNPVKKNLIIYSIFALLAINTHYYFVFFVFSNFLYVIAALIDKNEKKQILNFSIANLIAFLSFIPYFVIVQKSALNETFNSWIAPISAQGFSYIIKAFFINKYIFLVLSVILLCYIVIYYLPNKIRQDLPGDYKQKEEFLMYLTYTIVLILVLVSLVSIFIKPILHKRILLSIYSIMFLGEIALIMMVSYIPKIKEALALILMFLFFSMTKPMTAKEQYRFDDFMFFVQNDINNYSSDYEIHCITNDRSDYLQAYDIKDNERIIWHFVDTNAMRHLSKIEKSNYLKKSKSGVVYFHDMSADIDKATLLNPKAYIYNTNSNRIAKIVFKGEK